MRRALIFVMLLSVSAYAGGAGEYTGTWSSNSGAGEGKLRLAVSNAADAWACKLAYSIGDQPEIQAQRFSCAVEGHTLKGHYEVPSANGTARISLEAVLTGASFEGTYTETGPDGKEADSGKWKASPAPAHF